MRFMVMVKATKDSEAGKMPSEEGLAAMAKFNEEMVKAGVMLDGNGLQPSSKGARVRFAAGKLGETGNKRTVIDGPFAETKELVAGYWIIQVQVEGGGDRVDQALPQPAQRGERDRDPPAVRAGGLRRERRRSSTTAGSASRSRSKLTTGRV